MSLILDALNRADNERKNQNTVPDIGTLHTPRELTRVSNVGNKSGLIVTVAIVALGLIASLIWWIYASGQMQPITEPVAVVKPVEPEGANENTLSSPLKKETEISQPTEKIQFAEQKAPASTESPIPVSTHNVPVVSADVNQLYEAPEAAVAAGTEISELYAAESSAGSASVVDPFATEQANDIAMVESEPDTPPRTFASITNIPDFNALPWNMRQSIPTITYARHNFLASGVSSVVINNQTAGVGNIISVGQFVVQEIYVDGVVLKHGNTQFKLRALNGWINM